MKQVRIFLLCLFASQNAVAFVTQDISNRCNDYRDFYADFTINAYMCSAGYFLPADGLGCVACPFGQNCLGGTYDYNADYNQGLSYSILINNDLNNTCALNAPRNFVADWTANSYTCSTGYYLPANMDECTICPLNHYCVGGTYTFNETVDQGIESCNGAFAPVGSAVCYAHKLHVGDEALYLSAKKRTTPSLNVAYGNEVFYANATTTPTPITAGSSHYLKTIYNEQIYYICDDTSYNE